MYRRIALLALWAVVLAALGSAPAATAAEPNRAFELKIGGRATITFIAFCTEFGDKYPAQLTLPSDLAKPEVRAALQYIADNGLASDQTRALQGQYAIWNLLNQPAPAGDALAQQVVSYARANKVSDPQGSSLLDAARSKQVRLTLQSWEPASPVVRITPSASDNFYGRGTLLVENIANKALTLYMPVGALFNPSVQQHQTMAGYLADVTVTNPSLPNTSGGEPLLLTLAALFGGLVLVRVARLSRGRRHNV